MKIGIIQASSQKEKNQLLENNVRLAVTEKGYQVVNLGIYEHDDCPYSYIEIALCISLLLESNSVDFIVTGCSSGQGMMLACNSLPGVICGYIQNSADAFLFGRINNGNAVSYPLGLNFGWAAEINLRDTMQSLFDEPFGIGYPYEDSVRKRHDTELLKDMNRLSKRKLTEVLHMPDQVLVKKVLNYSVVYDYILENGADHDLVSLMKEMHDYL